MPPRPKPLLLIQAGTPPDDIRRTCGDIPDWFKSALALREADVHVVRVFAGERLPPPCAHQTVVITGSWAMVTEKPDWSETTAEWIRLAMRLEQPLFGVCYGHQLMAHALGGQVGYHPGGIEIGHLPVQLTPQGMEDGLVGGLPRTFSADLTHLQTVLALPPGTTVLAHSAHDPHQILRYGAHAMSTQFHPEFTPAILDACIQHRAKAHGQPTPAGAPPNPRMSAGETRALLRRFVDSHRASAHASAGCEALSGDSSIS